MTFLISLVLIVDCKNFKLDAENLQYYICIVLSNTNGRAHFSQFSLEFTEAKRLIKGIFCTVKL
jgi:hypothetical protein